MHIWTRLLQINTALWGWLAWYFLVRLGVVKPAQAPEERLARVLEMRRTCRRPLRRGQLAAGRRRRSHAAGPAAAAGRSLAGRGCLYLADGPQVRIMNELQQLVVRPEKPSKMRQAGLRARAAAELSADCGVPVRRIPVSLVRLSINALIATMAELPDMDSAATSGDRVNG